MLGLPLPAPLFFDGINVYQWFMEMFIDSYDWVMVPNVYGMSQFSDGGLMSTKPYISGNTFAPIRASPVSLSVINPEILLLYNK